MNQYQQHLFDRFLSAYHHLEQGVQRQMNRICMGICAACSSPCCRVDFCREARDSPFLKVMVRRYGLRRVWDARSGWLTSRGCNLSSGRPPVCYDFICEKISARQATNEMSYALRVLSALMVSAGRNAYGRRHLVEIQDLSRLNLPRLEKQCAVAMRVLDHLNRFWKHPASVCLDATLCQKICAA